MTRKGAEFVKKGGRFFQERGQILPPRQILIQLLIQLQTTSARAEQSSSTSTPHDFDDDDDFSALSFWLGDFSEQQYSARQLRSAAIHFGNESGLLRDWAGFEGFVARADPQKIAWLLTWLQHYGDKRPEEQERITNFPGLLRTHLKQDERAHLSPGQMRHLENFIALANATDGLPGLLEEITEEITARRNGGPLPAPERGEWIPADPVHSLAQRNRRALFPVAGH